MPCNWEEKIASGIPMYLQELSFKNFVEGFVLKIMSTLRNDDIRRIVRGDPNILYLGDKFYRLCNHKKEKSATVRKSVRGQIRLLATLYNIFCLCDEIQQTHHNTMNMFCRKNFDKMCIAFEVYR